MIEQGRQLFLHSFNDIDRIFYFVKNLKILITKIYWTMQLSHMTSIGGPKNYSHIFQGFRHFTLFELIWPFDYQQFSLAFNHTQYDFLIQITPIWWFAIPTKLAMSWWFPIAKHQGSFFCEGQTYRVCMVIVGGLPFLWIYHRKYIYKMDFC